MLWGLHSLFWCMCSWFTLLSQSGEPYAFCIDIVNFILVRSIAKWIYMIQIHQSGSWSRICKHGRCKKLTGRGENGITNLTYLLKDRFKCYKLFFYSSKTASEKCLLKMSDQNSSLCGEKLTLQESGRKQKHERACSLYSLCGLNPIL